MTSCGTLSSIETNGIILNLEVSVVTGFNCPITFFREISRPIYSLVSRNAVSKRSSSPSSYLPPGNEISPA